MNGLSPEGERAETACPNCGSGAAERFCPACGQRNRERLDGRQVLGEALDTVFSINGALPRTLRELTTDPGGVARRYVAGQRVSYIPPLRYCLLSLALYFLLNSWLGVQLVDPDLLEGGSNSQKELKEQVSRFIELHLSNILFLALPLFAWFLSKLYRRAGFNFAETYSFVLFVTGHFFLLSLVLVPLRALLPVPAILARLFGHMAFFTFGAVAFFDQKTVSGVGKAAFAFLLYMVSVFLLCFLVAFLFILSTQSVTGS